MTCIVGVVENNSIFMGGDSAGTSAYCRQIIRTPKVFIKQNQFIIGYTTSFRFGQLIEHDFHAPKKPDNCDIYTYMTSFFINDMRECLKNKGCAEKDKERESGGTLLVGFQGHLFEIQDDYSILETNDSFNAIGSGYAYALGAMSNSVEQPIQKIKSALNAAAKFCPSVAEPFHVFQLEASNER